MRILVRLMSEIYIGKKEIQTEDKYTKGEFNHQFFSYSIAFPEEMNPGRERIDRITGKVSHIC